MEREKKTKQKYNVHLGLYRITDKQLGDVKKRLDELAKTPAPHVLAARNREVLDSLKEHIVAALEQGYGENAIHDAFLSQGIDVSASVIRNYICQLKHGRPYGARKQTGADAADDKKSKTEGPLQPENVPPKDEKKTVPVAAVLVAPKPDEKETRVKLPASPDTSPKTERNVVERTASSPMEKETGEKEPKPAVAEKKTDAAALLAFSGGFEPMKIDANPIRFSGSPVVYEFLSGSVRRTGVYDCPIAGTNGNRSWSFHTTEGATFRVFEQDLRDGTCRAAKKDLRRC